MASTPFPSVPPDCPHCGSKVTYHAPRRLCAACLRWAHRGCAEEVQSGSPPRWRGRCRACLGEPRPSGPDS
jgi:hypothetical protein